LATAFEVFEHVPEPLKTIEQLYGLAEAVVFSTELVPKETKQIGDWAYFGTEHGQHISFHTEDSLRCAASSVGWEYVKLSDSWHFFGSPSDPLIREFQLAFGLRKRRFRDRLASWVARKLQPNREIRPSLFMEDSRRMKMKIQEGTFCSAQNLDLD
jgi:hypothetical protein